MKFFKDVFKFYLRSSIHVSLAVISLIWATCYFLNKIPGKELSIFIFSSTIATYNFIKYGVEAHKYLIVSNRYQRGIQLFSFVNLVLAFLYIGYLNKASILLLLIVAVLIGIYTIPVYPRIKNLRNYGIPKVLLVALVWTLITTVLPFLQYGIAWGWDSYIAITQRFILILVLMVPFEIRDLNVDLPELRTIPQRIGELATKGLGYFLAFVYFLLTFLKDQLHPSELLSKGFLLFMLVIALALTRKRQSGYFASFWVEGLPILWLGMIWLLETF
ncbi:hypothetical protein LVD13_08290 [Flavobacteriaceae bacterium D16]|nr:hypothetical protein [Flavobacteriaceae bacterium D16]